MANYRRNLLDAGSYFFTTDLGDRRLALMTEHIGRLRAAFRQVRTRHPFTIEDAAILPDYLHAIRTLPGRDANFALRLTSDISQARVRDGAQDWPYPSFRR